ncbi:hypothetical protein OSB04_002087 [Centaurea solstitialis]|uniref:Uncharacterized protein n=1 Tax=Centaurea solstitialis TaxID=347529 RepID=A0AA38WV69_9ASTR|nr:hypothetical protein OSB04_002087 [Centaurea solstitialis]
MVDTSSPPPAAGPSASVSSSQPPLVEPSGTSSSPSASSAEPSQPPAPATTSGHPMTTRSRTGSLKPKQIFNLSVTSDISPIPRSPAQAMCDPHWRAAMDAEMAAILSNYTWDLVPKPSDANIVGNRWLFRHKFDSNVTVVAANGGNRRTNTATTANRNNGGGWRCSRQQRTAAAVHLIAGRTAPSGGGIRLPTFDRPHHRVMVAASVMEIANHSGDWCGKSNIRRRWWRRRCCYYRRLAAANPPQIGGGAYC